ncbi:MAG: HDIG domain-containing protein [Candidatus Omnitrophica bacterium]|nr:HDIG domain-containing protein [Candidatus Omnitrophota bacterium]
MKDTSAKKPSNLAKRGGPPKESRLFWLGRAGIFLFSFLLVTGVVILERHEGMMSHEFIIGEPAPRTLFSPFELTYEDKTATEFLRDEAREAVLPVYIVDPANKEDIRKKTDGILEVIQSYRAAKNAAQVAKQPSVPVEAKTVALEKAEVVTVVEPKASFEIKPKDFPVEIREPSIEFLVEEAKLPEIRENLEFLFQTIIDPGIISKENQDKILSDETEIITIIAGDKKTERVAHVDEVLTREEALIQAEEILPKEAAKNKKLRSAILEIFEKLLSANMIFDNKETLARRNQAAEAIKPVEETIKKNELIAQRGMLVTAGIKMKIDEIQNKIKKYAIFNQLGSVSILVFLAYLVCFCALYYFERRALLSLKTLILIHSVFILSAALCKLFAVWPASSVYLMPAALAPLLLVLLTTPRLGIVSTIVISMIIAPIAKFSPDVLVACIMGGFAGTFASTRIRKRIQFIKVGFAVGFAMAAVLFAFQIFQEYPLLESFQSSLPGFVNGLFITTPLCFFLFLPLFESAFDLTTDITLLELSDLNHPLLKRMIVEAPGTYHHSLVVSTLAESACEAINANALLARVGCYFHDIGKIARAEFFMENQKDKETSRHEKLSPTMSSLIIMNHIKDGIELGKKNKIKAPILQFIPEHHGTGVVYYFYKKAMDSAQPGERISVDDFRYPGPKPQSRETAVALLADSAEAASRSLRDPSPESIRQLVRKIVNDKFIDGQLDECDLTLKDLHRIQESFVKNLMAIFHTRVNYPTSPEVPDKPDLFEHGQFDKFRFDSPNNNNNQNHDK